MIFGGRFELSFSVAIVNWPAVHDSVKRHSNETYRGVNMSNAIVNIGLEKVLRLTFYNLD